MLGATSIFLKLPTKHFTNGIFKFRGNQSPYTFGLYILYTHLQFKIGNIFQRPLHLLGLLYPPINHAHVQQHRQSADIHNCPSSNAAFAIFFANEFNWEEISYYCAIINFYLQRVLCSGRLTFLNMHSRDSMNE